MQARWYQTEARAAIYRALEHSTANPVVVLPTGSGKTIVIAEVARDVRGWGGRVLVLAHRKELLEQSYEKLLAIAPELFPDVGLLSAGLGRRDTECSILIAGIQSSYRRANEIGPRNLVIVDEAHLIPTDGEGMYQTLLNDLTILNRAVRVVGLTATPYRLDCGYVCGPDHFLNEVVYDVPIPVLIAEGHLSKLTSKAARNAVDASTVHVRGGDWVAGELDAICSEAALVEAACREIATKTSGRKSTLVFCSGRKHARAVFDELNRLAHGSCEYLDGETPAGERRDILERFKSGCVAYLINIDVLTTGFDAPNVDAIALLRPTLSPGLYYQMVGRGLRTAPGKRDCLVLDFGGNVERHGPIDRVEVGPKQSTGTGAAPAKACPKCAEVVPAGSRTCSSCGHEFPPPELKHDRRAAEAAILSSDVEPYRVHDHWYAVHTKRNAVEGTPRTLRIDYSVGITKTFSSWVCVEHDGFARTKAEAWWKARCKLPCPTDADEALRIAKSGLLAEPLEIIVDESGKFPTVLREKLGPIPEPDDIYASEGGAADESYDPFSDPLPCSNRNLFDEDPPF
jgi:DNA repair protein RadD